MIGVSSNFDVTKVEDVGTLAHEVFHAYQRSIAKGTDPARAFDDTQKAMEVEAYAFSALVVKGVLLDRGATKYLLDIANDEIDTWTGQDRFDALKTRTPFPATTYSSAPQGQGGTLDFVGIPGSLIKKVRNTMPPTATPTPTPMPTPTHTHTPQPTSTPTSTPTHTPQPSTLPDPHAGPF